MEAERKQKRTLLDRLRALRRAPPPPDPSIVAVMAQWAEYELIFNDILTRLNAQLARQAKADKKALERSLQDEPTEQHVLPLHQSPKAALRAAYASGRYGGRINTLLAAKEGTNEREHQSE